MVWFLVRDPLRWWSGVSPEGLIAAAASAASVPPGLLVAAAAWSVIAFEALLALAYLASGWVSRRRLGWAVAAAALAFHGTNEVFLMLQIGWFSWYMAAIALVCFPPESALCRVTLLLSRPARRVRVAAVVPGLGAVARLAAASAALTAGAARAADVIVQMQASPAPGMVATQPAVNTVAVPLEYADGKKFPLQSFVSPVSSSDGLGYILVSDEEQGDGAWANRCLIYGTTRSTRRAASTAARRGATAARG
jgi:hypothetical protein